MAKELYVGSLSYDVTEYDLEKLFSVCGRVTSIHLITDPKTGQFKGCGYVRMSTEAEAKDAIQSLDGALLIDRTITVSMANPQKQQKPQGGGYKGKPAGAKGGVPGKPSGGKTHAAGPSSKPADRRQSPKPAAAKSTSRKAGK